MVCYSVSIYRLDRNCTFFITAVDGVTFSSGIKNFSSISMNLGNLIGALGGKVNFASDVPAEIAVDVHVEGGALEAEFLAEKGAQTAGL